MNKWILLGSVAPVLGGGLVGLDLLVDPDDVSVAELVVDLVEKSILVGAMISVALLVGRVTRVEHDADRMRADIGHAISQGAAWRAQSRQLMESLSAAIVNQFEAWGLTPAETDIAGLMLKGLSLKDIAELRNTTEATIRQQAQGVYRKSGLANRAQLLAYFLEDLYEVANSSELPEDPHPPLN